MQETLIKKIDLAGSEWIMYSAETPLTEPEFHQKKQQLPHIACNIPDQSVNILAKSKMAPPPYEEANYSAYLKYEKVHFWFEKTFNIPPALLTEMKGSSHSIPRLVLEGLDTFGEIFLNGQKIATTDNMHLRWQFPIPRDGLHEQTNELVIHISPVPTDNLARSKIVKMPVKGWNTRKAQHMFGWDIFPRILSGGIYRPLYLEFAPQLKIDRCWIETLKINTDNADQKAELACGIVVTPDIPKNLLSLPLHIELRIQSPTANQPPQNQQPNTRQPILITKDITLDPTTNIGLFSFELPSPALWFPKPYSSEAEPPVLYTAHIQIQTEGILIYENDFPFGVRLVTIEQSPRADGGQQFRFQINGKPLFVMGTDWVPLDALHMPPPDRLKAGVALVVDLHCNMIRVWGGGGYPVDDHEAFYRLCDEQGLLVWQDFMFACGRYPASPEMIAQMDIEVPNIVHRLRGHPSLGILCGDNENERDQCGGVGYHGSIEDFNPIGRRIIPAVLHQIQCKVPYIPSSPFNPQNWREPDNPLIGNSHLWHHGESFQSPKYFRLMPSFISEIGHLSLPSTGSLAKFLSPKALQVPGKDRKLWGVHFGDVPQLLDIRNRFGKMAKAMQIYYRMKDRQLRKRTPLADWVFLSQCLHGEAHKYWIETCRVRQDVCGGIIWWNLLDGWPQCSDAVVDYYLDKKLSFYITRQSQQAILPIMTPSGEVWLVNNSPEPISGEIILDEVEICLPTNPKDLTFTTKIKPNCQNFSVTILKSNQSVKLGAIPLLEKSRAFVMRFKPHDPHQNHTLNYTILAGNDFGPLVYRAVYEQIATVCDFPNM